MTVILVAFASCSSKKTQISMKPETTTISGDLSECFEVVDQECIVKLDKKGGIEPFATWSVKLRRTDKPFPFADDIDVSAYGTWGPSVEAHGGFGIEVVDENGTTVQKSAATGSGFSGPYSHEDVEDLFKLKPGETGTIRWSVEDNALNAKELKFTISSAFELCEKSGDSSNNYSDDDDLASSKGSTNWDAVLNEYESYVNQYIALMKKVQKGDMSAMSEYPKMLEKAERLSDKLDDAEDEMTSTQLSRYLKITNKMANAAF
jgi:hypothetical protein